MKPQTFNDLAAQDWKNENERLREENRKLTEQQNAADIVHERLITQREETATQLMTALIESGKLREENRRMAEQRDFSLQQEKDANESLAKLAPVLKEIHKVRESLAKAEEELAEHLSIGKESGQIIVSIREERDSFKRALEEIQRIPTLPFPDRVAHSERAFADAVWRAWSRIQQVANTALAPNKTGPIG